MAPDPYRVLGLRPDASDAELRAAYRRAVQRHHPDHNGGSAEATRRFEEVQEAYAQIRELRAQAQAQGPAADPTLENRLAELERELRLARESRERAARQAREEAARQASSSSDDRAAERPSDEELGYIRTEDSFGRILGDAAEELLHRIDGLGHGAHAEHAAEQAADLLDDLSARLRRRGQS